MRYIQKGVEPRELRDRRNPAITPGTSYEALPALRLALAREQGYLCAFCMRRLTIGPPIEGRPTTKIAHLIARNWTEGPQADQERREALSQDYHNMVLACNGFSGIVTHCDEYQGNRDITIPLFNRAEMARVQFSTSGRISHPNRDFDKQLNERDADYETEMVGHNKRPGFLNLNAEALITRRRQRWVSLGKILNKVHRFNRNGLLEQRVVYSGINSEKRLQEDCQYIIAQIDRSLKEL